MIGVLHVGLWLFSRLMQKEQIGQGSVQQTEVQVEEGAEGVASEVVDITTRMRITCPDRVEEQCSGRQITFYFWLL